MSSRPNQNAEKCSLNLPKEVFYFPHWDKVREQFSGVVKKGIDWKKWGVPLWEKFLLKSWSVEWACLKQYFQTHELMMHHFELQSQGANRFLPKQRNLWNELNLQNSVFHSRLAFFLTKRENVVTSKMIACEFHRCSNACNVCRILLFDTYFPS